MKGGPVGFFNVA